MLAPKAPRSVHDNRPVAVLVVKQQKSGAVDKHLLIVDEPRKTQEPLKPEQAPDDDQAPKARAGVAELCQRLSG